MLCFKLSINKYSIPRELLDSKLLRADNVLLVPAEVDDPERDADDDEDDVPAAKGTAKMGSPTAPTPDDCNEKEYFTI